MKYFDEKTILSLESFISFFKVRSDMQLERWDGGSKESILFSMFEFILLSV